MALWLARSGKHGDRIVAPGKRQPAVHIAEILGDCEFDAQREPACQHSRRVAATALQAQLREILVGEAP